MGANSTCGDYFMVIHPGCGEKLTVSGSKRVFVVDMILCFWSWEDTFHIISVYILYCGDRGGIQWLYGRIDI